MTREIKTIREAAEEWVKEMDAIQQDIISTLMSVDIDDWTEVTTPRVCDRVYHYDSGETGEVTNIVDYTDDNGDECYYYEITLDNGEIIRAEEANEFEVERDDLLPMWSVMWSFRDSCDDWWLEEQDGIRIMSECGFRVYNSYKYGYFFGIDGAGYSFYDEHWIPLYKKRGLKWHDEEV